MRAVIGWLEQQYQNESARIKIIEDYQKTFEQNGGEVLEDLRRFCMVYDTTHVPGDSNGTAINEGKRQAYLHLVHMLETRFEEIELRKKKGKTDERDTPRPEMADD